MQEDAPVDFYFYSTDEGKTWISWPQADDVDFINESDGWRMSALDGSYLIEQTQDGGRTWQTTKDVQWQGDLDFIDAQNGWALASYGDDFALLKTSDGGKTWQDMKPVVTSQ